MVNIDIVSFSVGNVIKTIQRNKVHFFINAALKFEQIEKIIQLYKLESGLVSKTEK